MFSDSQGANVDLEIVAGDLPKAILFLKDVAGVAAEMKTSIYELIKTVQDGDFDFSKGISLLDVKCHTMLSYLINMSHLILRKCHGNSIEDDPSILRLVEHRTVLEKIRPIEQKLKYHISKLVKASTGVVNDNDPRNYRANPQNLVSKLGDDDQLGSEADGKNSNDRVTAYVPPKLSSVPYDDDNGPEEREKRQIERARKRALSSTIMRELKAEFFDGPEEITDYGKSVLMKETYKSKNRREFEEEFLTRLPVTRKEKIAEKRYSQRNVLNGLTDFGDTTFLAAEDNEEGFGIPAKKSKKPKKMKKSKKHSKKKFRNFKK